MRTAPPLPQEPFRNALREAHEQLRARCQHCPLPPTVARVAEWDRESWFRAWADAAAAARRRASFCLNDGLTEEAGRGYWLAALFYRTAARFLDTVDDDPRHAPLTTGEAACLRMVAMLGEMAGPVVVAS
jgi:hypothetical protein